MTFEGQYLTYAEYQQLGGSAIGDMPFNLLEYEARKLIDARTFNRLKNQEEVLQDVKLCEYELINKIQSYLDVSNTIGNVSSENTDGYSISYVTADRVSDIVKSKKSDLDDTIRTYLINVIVDNEHVMYVGVK
jgi:hypothetical protein